MGHWIDEDTYQFDDEAEAMRYFGVDPETFEGDYAEAVQHLRHHWDSAKIDMRFKDGRK